MLRLIIILLILVLFLLFVYHFISNKLRIKGAGASCGKSLFNNLYYYIKQVTKSERVKVWRLACKFGILTHGSEEKRDEYSYKEYEGHQSAQQNHENYFTNIFREANSKNTPINCSGLCCFNNIQLSQTVADMLIQQDVCINMMNNITELIVNTYGFKDCNKFISPIFYKTLANGENISAKQIRDLIMCIEECCGHYACGNYIDSLTDNGWKVGSDTSSDKLWNKDKTNFPPKYEHKADWLKIWAFDNNNEFVVSSDISTDLSTDLSTVEFKDLLESTIINNTFSYLLSFIIKCCKILDLLIVYKKGNTPKGTQIISCLIRATEINKYQDYTTVIGTTSESDELVSPFNHEIFVWDENRNGDRILNKNKSLYISPFGGAGKGEYLFIPDDIFPCTLSPSEEDSIENELLSKIITAMIRSVYVDRLKSVRIREKLQTLYEQLNENINDRLTMYLLEINNPGIIYTRYDLTAVCLGRNENPLDLNEYPGVICDNVSGFQALHAALTLYYNYSSLVQVKTFCRAMDKIYKQNSSERESKTYMNMKITLIESQEGGNKIITLEKLDL